MRFYLGTHQPHWLRLTAVPLFVSIRRLRRLKTFPRAVGGWALDSGGFTELSTHGRWTVSAEQYVRETRRVVREIGMLEWAAPQDWMCEPIILDKTGMTVRNHQRRTTDNFIQLQQLAPEVPWRPVVQGWELGDYLRHVGLYDSSGVDLATMPLVGVGSVCRRQSTKQIGDVITNLSDLGLKLHGLGVKTGGLRRYGKRLASADSMAWSYAARYEPPMAGHTHKNCANCLEYALAWRSSLVGPERLDHVMSPQLLMPWGTMSGT